MSMFQPATRTSTKARIALAGPSGSGKTYTGLALACAMAERVAVVDTERGSASKYAGLNGWAFDTVAPDSFSPKSLVEILTAAGREGYGCVVVDSLSHYWMGSGGMLEQVDRLTRQSRSGNSFSSGWKEARPDERRLIDALVSFPGHVIVTLRVKTEYIIEEDSRGRKVPRKVGLKPEQRDGLEYEFDVVADLDLDNTLVVSKSRIPVLSGAVVKHAGAELAVTIRDWLADGVPAAPKPPPAPASVAESAPVPAGRRNVASVLPSAEEKPAVPVSQPLDPNGEPRRRLQELTAERVSPDFGVVMAWISDNVGHKVSGPKELTLAETKDLIARLEKLSGGTVWDETKESA